MNNGTSGKVSSFFSHSTALIIYTVVSEITVVGFFVEKIATKITVDLGETHETKI